MFSVYDEDEFHDPKTPDRKWKTLYLREFKEQILSQSNLSWSTASLQREHDVNSNDVGQVSDRRRSALPGACIKSIINTTFDNIKVFGKPMPKNKFDKQWDEGGATIFYSSPANARPMDDIEYILDRTVSSDDSDNGGVEPLFKRRRVG